MIIEQNKKPGVYLGDLTAGYVFKYKDMFYIKTDYTEDGESTCVSLGAGLLTKINQWAEVEHYSMAKLILGE